MRGKTWIILTAALLAGVAVVVFFVLSAYRKTDALLIGVVVPLSGDAAPYGDSLRTGAELAANQINADGGIAGHRLHLIFEDSKGSPKDAVTSINKLIGIDRVRIVIGDMFSHTTLAMAPIAQRNHVVLLSPTASAKAVPQTGDYVFTIYPSDAQDGQFLAEKLVSRSSSKATVAVIYAQVEAMETCKSAFVETLQQMGHQAVVLEEAIPTGVHDLKPVVAKVAARKPDWVLLATFLPETAKFLRDAREQGLETRALGISTCYDPKLFELAGVAADNLLFSAPIFDDESDLPAIRRFVSDYHDTYGKKPDVWAAYGYDAVNIIGEAMRACGDDLDRARAALAAIRGFNGATGTTTFRQDRSADKSLRLLRVNAEKRQFIPAD